MTFAPFVLPRQTALDDNASPLSGAKLYFYNAGTTTPRATYQDKAGATPHANPVVADAAGRWALIFLDPAGGDYKVVFKTSADVTIYTTDNIPVTPEESTAAAGGGATVMPVIVKTSSYTVAANEVGKTHNCNPTSGDITVTMLSAGSVDDGDTVTFRHSGTAGAVIFSGLDYVMTVPGQTVTYRSDLVDWVRVDDGNVLPVNAQGALLVTDRLSSPPTAPSAGAIYIAAASATGGWTTGRVYIADGTGGWIEHVPAAGWFAWITDEDVFSVYDGSAWEDLSNVTAPTSSALKVAIWSDEKATNTSGGTSVDDTWTTHALNTERSNTITGASLASNQITLPTGKYRIDAQISAYAMSETQIRLYSVTNSTVKGASVQVYTSNFTSAGASILSGAPIVLTAYVDVTAASEVFALQYHTTVGGVASSLGRVRNIGSENEVYALVTVLDLASIQGPRGADGPQGSDGLDAAYPYQWSTSTSGDPGSGKIAGNNATIASITQIAVSETDSAGGSMGNVIATWDDSTSSNKATIKISKEGATNNFHSFRITGAGTDHGAHWTFPVSYITTSGTISNGNDCAVLVIEKGDKGDTGATGATGSTGATGATGPNTGLDYAFNTSISGDPGSGKALYNSATLASITQINISKTGRNGEALSGYLATWDDSTNTTHRGHLRIFTVADRSKFVELEITGTLTDNSTYYSVPVSYSSGGMLHANADLLSIMFERTGNIGTSGEWSTVASVAALKALSGGAFSSVRTAGYTSAGDGGGMEFRWDSSSTASDDGGTIITPNAGGTGRWKAVLTPGERLTPHHFGCVGDNSTDDTVNLAKWSAHMATGAWRYYGAKQGATYLFYTSGTASSGAKLIDLTGIADLDFDFAGASFRCNYAGDFLTTFMKLTDCDRPRISSLTGVYDRGLPPSNPTWGMQWLQPFGCDDLVMEGADLDGGAIGVAFGRGPGGSNARSRRPTITGKFRRVFYPLTCQADGDGGGRFAIDVRGAGRGALMQNVNGIELDLDCGELIIDALDTGPTYAAGDTNEIANFVARVRATLAGVSGGTAKTASPTVGTYNMTVTGHGYGSAGDPVLLYLSAASNPTPLATGNIYICKVVDANTLSFQPDQAAGALAAFSSAGTTVTVQRTFPNLIDISVQTNGASCRYSNVAIAAVSDSRGCVATGALLRAETYSGGSLGDGTGVDINGLTLRFEHRGDTVSGIPCVSLFEAASGWGASSPNIYCGLELYAPEITRSIGVGTYARVVKSNVKTTLEDIFERWTGSSSNVAIDRTGKLFFDAAGGYATNAWTLGSGSSAFVINTTGGQDIQYNHNADLRQAVRRSGDITPTALVANTDNWAPTGGTTASVWRISASTPVNLTGIANGTDGTELELHNTGASAITLKDESASSTAANRFALVTDIVLSTDQSAKLWYDATSSRWRSVGGSGSVTGAALTKGDDTNVTLTLGGSPTTALLAAASITAGWTGSLAVGRGGTGITSGTSGGVPYFSGTTTIASSGALTANAVVKGGGAGAAPVASGVTIDASDNITLGSTVKAVSASQSYMTLQCSSAGTGSLRSGRFVTNYSAQGHFEVQYSADNSTWATSVDYDLINNRMGVAKANPAYTVDSAGIVNSDIGFYKSGVQVVGARGAAVTAPTGGATIDAESRTAIAAIISRMQAHGLIS